MSLDAAEWNTLAVDIGKGSLKMVATANKIIRKVTLDGQREAQAFAPVDTGNLRSSITADVRGLEGEFGPTADYGDYVESGTSTQAPQAFVGPAFDRQQPVLADAVAHLTDVIL